MARRSRPSGGLQWVPAVSRSRSRASGAHRDHGAPAPGEDLSRELSPVPRRAQVGQRAYQGPGEGKRGECDGGFIRRCLGGFGHFPESGVSVANAWQQCAPRAEEARGGQEVRQRPPVQPATPRSVEATHRRGISDRRGVLPGEVSPSRRITLLPSIVRRESPRNRQADSREAVSAGSTKSERSAANAQVQKPCDKAPGGAVGCVIESCSQAPA